MPPNYGLTMSQILKFPGRVSRRFARSKWNQDFSAFWTSTTASVDRNIRRKHHAMAAKDGFDPGDPLPLFFFTDEPDQGIGNDKAVISLRGLMVSISVAAAIATGIAILSDRVTLFADVTASPVDKSVPQPGTDDSTPTIQSTVIQSTADAEAWPPTAKDAPNREISTSEPASQTQAENSEASSEALFREFQAWKAKQDARDLAKVRDAPAPVVKDAPASVRSVQRQRRAEEPSFLQSLFSPFGASPPQRGP